MRVLFYVHYYFYLIIYGYLYLRCCQTLEFDATFWSSFVWSESSNNFWNYYFNIVFKEITSSHFFFKRESREKEKEKVVEKGEQEEKQE